MDRWAIAASVAECQLLLITSWQLRLLGISSRAIGGRVQAHGWSRVHRGIIALPGPGSPRRQMAAALLRYSHPSGAIARVDELRSQGRTLVEALVGAALDAGPVLWGPSAAYLWRLLDQPPGEVHIALPEGWNRQEASGVRLRYGPVPGMHRAWAQGLPTADVDTAILGCGPLLGEGAVGHHRLVRIVATADALRLTTPERLGARAKAAGEFEGRGRFRAVLADLKGELSHSATEAKARRLATPVLARHGLPLHSRPFAITLDGRRVGEADLAVPAIRLDVEIDGPHHDLLKQRRLDQQRDRLVRRAGWEVERFSTETIDNDPRAFTRALDELVTASVRRTGKEARAG